MPDSVVLGQDTDGSCLGTIMKLLHHSDVSSNSNGTKFCSSYNLYKSFLNGSCSIHDILLSSAWCGFAPSLTCDENMSLKHPIPVNTSLY